MNNFGALFGKLIESPVGNNRENKDEDVQRVKGIFSNLGYYKKPVENGIIDQELDTAIHSFQKDRNLKVDGYMNPGGETEKMIINALLDIGRSRKSTSNNASKEESEEELSSSEEPTLYDEKEKRQICIDVWNKIFQNRDKISQASQRQIVLDEKKKQNIEQISKLKELVVDPSKVINIDLPKRTGGKAKKTDILEGVFKGVELGEKIINIEELRGQIKDLEEENEDINSETERLSQELETLRERDESLMFEADALDCSPI